MFPPEKYGKSIFRNAHYIIAFKNPRDLLGMKNLLLQAFPTCRQDMIVIYQKVGERLFGYMVLDLPPASDDRRRVFSHLLTNGGYPRWHRRKLEMFDVYQSTSQSTRLILKRTVLGEGQQEKEIEHGRSFTKCF